jgi:transcriptional regulator with XRE-family HTH domain
MKVPLEALKEFRKSQEPPLSQRQLAHLLEVTRETIARWESGARKIDDDRLPAVSQKTGISPTKLRPDLAENMREPIEAAE